MIWLDLYPGLMGQEQVALIGEGKVEKVLLGYGWSRAQPLPQNLDMRALKRGVV